MTKFILYINIFLLLLSCKSQVPTNGAQQHSITSSRVAFYNVENLFDTKDDRKKKDEEFTPKSEKQWTKERYQTKLTNIAKVIAGMELPSLVGLCEVENSRVLKDLAKQPALQAAKYGFVHHESPDVRGIDVALLYSKTDFKVLEENTIAINFPESIVKNYTTRDILHVKGLYRGNTSMHIFVNHWPSRYGGAKESEPKRTYVAAQLRTAIDAVFAQDENANIIIVGDFNDETNNRSVQQILKAQRNTNRISPKNLFNCFAKADDLKQGTYNYRGNLNVIDQIIVSSTLANKASLPAIGEAVIYRPDWISFRHKKYGTTPNRTYGGKNYYGGYSDHYPIYVDLKVK